MNASFFDQFKLKKMLYMKLSETIMSMSNLTLLLMMMMMLIIILNKSQKIIPSRYSIIMTSIFNISDNLTKEHLKEKNHTYKPLMFSMLKMFIMMNLLGLLPYVLTPTSLIMMTFSLSLTMIMKTTMSSFINHKFNFFSIFTPHSSPMMLAPFLVIMETMSYMTRAMSLGIRLAANITAGHLLLTMLSTFTLNMMLTSSMMMWALPMMMLMFMSLLEMMVALMQAYVFTLLTTMYLSDTMKLH